ncbi:MAG: septum site-determining protein MinD, partial [Thermicanus sp.]|nr:septum site-determining protein MinD [Thermicanus sp.]
MIDTDIGLRNLDVLMGLENRIIFDLVDVVEGRCRLEQAIVRDKHFEDRLVMLPAAQTKDKSAVTPDQMKKLVEKLKPSYDYILLDSPAGIEQGFNNAVAGADQAIVVTTPEVSSIRDADRVIGILEKRGLSSPKLIINRIRPHMTKKLEQVGVDEIVQILGIDLLGIVPDDEAIIKMTNEGVPTVMDPHSRASQAYRNIARRILGETVPLMRLEAKESVFGKMKKMFGL